MRIRWSKRLSSGLPGTSAGPDRPPRRIPSNVRRSSEPSCAAAPWHAQQCCMRIGVGRCDATEVGVEAARLGLTGPLPKGPHASRTRSQIHPFENWRSASFPSRGDRSDLGTEIQRGILISARSLTRASNDQNADLHCGSMLAAGVKNTAWATGGYRREERAT